MATELEDEVRELKREVIESRGLVIKTNNLTNALSADLKSISKRQAGYERRISWNSASAYISFIVVVLLGVKILWDYQYENLRSGDGGAKVDLEKARAQIKELERRDEARQKSESHAHRLYELAKAGKRAEFLEQVDLAQRDVGALTKTELAIFLDFAERYRNELALERYSAGLDHARVARFQEAATAFEESLKIKPESTTSASTRFALAQAYRKLSRQRDAVPVLQALSDSTTVDKEIQAAAMWELAQCQVEIQAWNDAKATLRNFAKKYPDHARNADARVQLQELQLKH